MPSIVGLLTFTRKNPEEGDETTASCGWTGSPDPEVTWYKDGSPLREVDLPARIRITMSSDGDMFQSSLQINPVEVYDAGNYTCNVSNPVGVDFRTDILEVTGIFYFDVMYPTDCSSIHIAIPETTPVGKPIPTPVGKPIATTVGKPIATTEGKTIAFMK